MQFNSFVFILLFLPMTILLYFGANRLKFLWGKIVLIVASIIFYTYSGMKLATILGMSLLMNFGVTLLIQKAKKPRIFFLTPIAVNIGLLLYFKYTNFFIGVMNQHIGTSWALRELMQPLGISFFTFQQIAYIVAVYKKEIDKVSVTDYLAYILFFPKILMGPLMDPVDFIHQINDDSGKKENWDNIACGVKIFCFGLFKKVMIADIFAKGVTWAFSDPGAATAADWILITLFYTFEIYFDFSGYSDMAVGVAQMLNITLPINFDSPYKAISIRDFWNRWHISLTKFFTKYVYIPLGGSRKGAVLTYVNTMLVFLLSGFWHGANYTFILWGVLHGLFMVADRVCENIEIKIFEPLRWFLTFCVVNALWLLFRAESVGQWKGIIKTILKMQNTTISDGLIACFRLPEVPFLLQTFHLERVEGIRDFWLFVYVIVAMGTCLVPDNNYKTRNRLSVETMMFATIAFAWGLICLSSESVFVYFNF